ncbi:flagellar motor stator protein MotA [Pacificimonas sp. WHA3]|uniref:Flagellar motor stator protein MotA n=1 Tax=Pacificimonas pallii TaxID=2827236 RepID=A0ABS6SF38_9SPHN|nr:flagellar motor stator protein MotA [Pacificimonas pallii]MBV7257022.1 flagellar motor stator protein MotA [Pacificimonas pallii]
MLFGIGFVVLFVMVFGGYMVAGGSLGPVLVALPFEFMIIGGAALGATLMGNSGHLLKGLGSSVKKIFSGPRWTSEDYNSSILLTARLLKLMKNEGPVAVESHVEEPESSELFADYPNLMQDPFLIRLITDTLRLQVISPGGLEPHMVEEIMDNAIKSEVHEAEEPVHVLQTLADALPALGIVAAVLGVIKTMGSIDQPPAVLGGMIGGALVGTFLGVFLAYGIVGPMACRLKQVLHDDLMIYQIVKQMIVASLADAPQAVVIEAARTSISPHHQPSFSEVFDALREAA